MTKMSDVKGFDGPVCYEDVENAAFTIVESGKERPSQKDVLQALGRGSEGTIGKFLNEFYRTNLNRNKLGGLSIPSEVQKEMVKVWRISTKYSSEAELKKFEDDRKAFNEELANLADEKGELESSFNDLSEQYDEECTRSSNLVDQIHDLNASHSDLVSVLEKLQIERRDKNTELNVLNDAITHQASLSEQRYEAMESSLNNKLTSEANAYTQEIEHLNSIHTIEMEHLKATLGVLTSDNNALEAELASSVETINQQDTKLNNQVLEITGLTDNQKSLVAKVELLSKNIEAEERRQEGIEEVRSGIDEKMQALIISDKVQSSKIESLESELRKSESRYDKMMSVQQQRQEKPQKKSNHPKNSSRGSGRQGGEVSGNR